MMVIIIVIIITINDYGMDDHLALFFLSGHYMDHWMIDWIIFAGIVFEVLSIGDTWRGQGGIE